MRTGRTGRTFGAALAIALVSGIAFAARAQEEEVKGDHEVQLAAVTVPAVPSPKTQSRFGIVTIFVYTGTEEEGKFVCAVSPRLYNAVNQSSRRAAFPRTNDGRLNLAAIKRRLRPVILSNIKPVKPTRIEIIEGDKLLKGDPAAILRAKRCVVIKPNGKPVNP